MGVYGTIIGVGVMSIFTTVGTDIYLRSLHRTRRIAERSWVRTVKLPGSQATADTAELSSASDTAELSPASDTVELSSASDTVELPNVSEAADQPEMAEVSHRHGTADQAGNGRRLTSDQPTVAFPGPSVAADEHDADATATLPPETDGDDGGPEGDRAASPGPSRWTPARIAFVAAAAVASFVIALLIITGIESVSGSSLSGQGRTTIGELGGFDGSTDPDQDSDEVDEPGQPVPTEEPDRSSQTPADPLDIDERDAPVPPAEEVPDPEEPETPSPSPTESPTPEPTEQSEGGDGAAADLLRDDSGT